MLMGFNKEEEEGGEEEMVRDVFRGRIFSSSFGRGDRIVIGKWEAVSYTHLTLPTTPYV